LQKPPDKNRLRRALFSIATSILATFVAAFALDEFTYSLGFTGTINGFVIVVWTLFVAFLYSLFSASMFGFTARKTIFKVGRNVFVAVVVTLVNITFGYISFTIWASQNNCINCNGPVLRYFYSSLNNGFLAFLFAVFVAVSVFSFEFTRRGLTPAERPMVANVSL
jgi:hypothetical protein